MSIHFGTDGWRAVISDTFTFANVRLLTQAVAQAVRSPAWHVAGTVVQPDVAVVGYDTRFLSDAYAAATAEVLAANGFRVYLAQQPAPTPVISFACRELQAVVAVMITASHNPARYNGYKLKAAFGGSALNVQAQLVEEELASIQASGGQPRTQKLAQAVQNGQVVYFDPLPSYGKHLQTLLDFNAISQYSRQAYVLADAMYGAGSGVFEHLLTPTQGKINGFRQEHNPGFNGICPEPILRYLHATIAAVKTRHADVAIITDGDADRIGALDAHGNFVDPHQILALTTQYLVEHKQQRGAIVKTVSTTQMLNRQARHYGLKLYETPVGFNHIVDHMLQESVLVGGEESGGMSIVGHIPEGDGILMGLLLLEMLAVYQTPLHQLVSDLQKRFGPTHYERLDQHLHQPVAKKEMVRRLTTAVPAQIAGLTLQTVQTLDGVKYLFADDSWLLIRPSGTEPVLRLYAESDSTKRVQALLNYAKQIAE